MEDLCRREGVLEIVRRHRGYFSHISTIFSDSLAALIA